MSKSDLCPGDYAVTLSFDVTAADFEQAAEFGVDDMKDAIRGLLPGCIVRVRRYDTGEEHKVSIDTLKVER